MTAGVADHRDRRGTGDHPAVAVVDVRTRRLRLVSGNADTSAGALVLLRDGHRTTGLRRLPGRWSASLHEILDGPAAAPAVRPDPPPLSATVAICTLGAHPRLRESVEAVLAQSRPAERVLVVDNDPDTGATRRALAEVRSDRLRVVPEPRRGLSHARNRALAGCDTDVLAFTDDDAIADRGWLEALLHPFAAGPVDAVTGLVVPAELRTPAQRSFEAYVGFGKGLCPVHWSIHDHPGLEAVGAPGPRGVLFPWTAGKVGSGNNMAFRVAVLRRLGGFDTALGAGTPAQGGEDLDAFTRVLLDGSAIAYTPDSVVWHYHREEQGQLARQIRGNGVGMGALLAKAVLRDPAVAGVMLRRTAALGRDTMRSRGRAGGQPGESSDPAERRRLLLQEVAGLVSGPWWYAVSRRREGARWPARR